VISNHYASPGTNPGMASGKYKAQLVRGGVSKEIEIIVEEGGRSVVDLDELL